MDIEMLVETHRRALRRCCSRPRFRSAGVTTDARRYETASVRTFRGVWPFSGEIARSFERSKNLRRASMSHRFRSLFVVAALLLVSAYAVAAPKPAQFSGKWTLDPARSKNLPPVYEHIGSHTLD